MNEQIMETVVEEGMEATVEAGSEIVEAVVENADGKVKLLIIAGTAVAATVGTLVVVKRKEIKAAASKGWNKIKAPFTKKDKKEDTTKE